MGCRLLSVKVMRPHVRANRPILILSVPVSERIEIRRGCQFISILVRALAKLPGGLGRFLPCRVGSHMSRLRHLGWNQCSHGLTSGHVCGGFWAVPKGQRRSFWMAPSIFSTLFLPWYLPEVGNGSGKRQSVTLVHLLDDGGNSGGRVRLTRKTRPEALVYLNPDPGHPTPRRGKRLLPPSCEGEEGSVPRNLFPRLGVG